MFYGITYINDMSLYELYNPDIFTIEYIANDSLVYKEYYDFVNESYDFDNDVVDPNQWSDSERAQKIPRFVKTSEDSDGDSWLNATAPDGVSKLRLSKTSDRLTVWLDDK